MVGAVCLLLSSTVYAEDLKSTDANIVGHVIEKSTREHLPYMTVSLKPIALRMVWQVAKAVKIPVIGLGGIMNWKDAVEFMLAGASAIQIGTANFIDPAVTVKVVEGINDYLNRHGYQSVKDIIGALEV